MGKYGMLTCPDCGIVIDKTAPTLKRCKPCALKAHGQTGHGWSDRACVMCGNTYKPTMARQKACATCSPEYKRLDNVKRLREYREKAGSPKVGSVLMCSTCGDDFVYSAGPQKTCKRCQQIKTNEATLKWMEKYPRKTASMRQRAQDNFMFSGNRAKALERDNHTCQRCGTKDDLHVHHIDGRGVTTPKEFRNNALENLLTVCRSCHTTIHAEERHSACPPNA